MNTPKLITEAEQLCLKIHKHIYEDLVNLNGLIRLHHVYDKAQKRLQRRIDKPYNSNSKSQKILM